MNAIKKSVLLAGICLLATLGTSRAAVTLSLLNNATGLSSLSITPGQSFSLNGVVAGLTSPALDSFDFELASLPTGVTLGSFTNTLPSGWIDFENVAEKKYGGANFSGSSVTGSANLMRANFTTSGSLAPGVYIIDFVSTNPASQILRDSSAAAIPYTDNSFSLTVTAVPEPSTVGVSILLAAVVGLAWYRRRTLAKASIRVRS